MPSISKDSRLVRELIGMTGPQLARRHSGVISCLPSFSDPPPAPFRLPSPSPFLPPFPTSPNSNGSHSQSQSQPQGRPGQETGSLSNRGGRRRDGRECALPFRRGCIAVLVFTVFSECRSNENIIHRRSLSTILWDQAPRQKRVLTGKMY